MGENQKIVLSFKNAKNLQLPNRVAEELEGVEIKVWGGYPQGETIIILDQLIPDQSKHALNNEGSFLVQKSELVEKLAVKKANCFFAKNWIEKYISSRYIRVTKDCIRQ